jgi:hypothetical protein
MPKELSQTPRNIEARAKTAEKKKQKQKRYREERIINRVISKFRLWLRRGREKRFLNVQKAFHKWANYAGFEYKEIVRECHLCRNHNGCDSYNGSCGKDAWVKKLQ